ncbi:cyclic AMP-dependent transcription factor ATF-4 [Gymnodraco acuticeps]|uniref:Cyclic AMP-dependent transcription factor ATF-4 n=1 Tax=Gymnodraco acuticeps TaxID=8218 RepID=A0A6P8TF84_GYMAC|nr:cyclic AMP-dependent transcription factor ATF-4 [Gymnodraco acuticeps]
MTLCLALEDVEALNLGPSFLTADPMGPLLDHEDEEALSPSCYLEGKAPASPPLSFSSSPPPSHASLFLGTKASEDPLAWLLHAPTGAEHCSDDAFAGMDWMSEKIDLSELDLESLIGSDDSREELLASLDPHMDLDAFHSSLPLPLDPHLDAFHSSRPLPLDPHLDVFHSSLPLPLDPHLDVFHSSLPLPLDPHAFHSSLPLPLDPHLDAFHSSLPLPLDPHLEEEVVLKSEPPSPAFTLDLGSEEDVLDVLSSPVVLPSPPSSGHMLVVNALSDQPIKTSPPSSDCESDSGIESFTDSPPRLLSSPPTPTLPSSSRTKPYSKKPEPSSSSSSSISIKMKSVSGAPKVVEKKLKKMEQNKTAATRYRQKKRVEQDLVSEECEELMKKNEALEERAEAISREIRYLTELMEEVRRRRNKSKAL